MSEYLTAVLFGAVIIAVFAWDQFNRPSYEKARELTRLIELLTPSDMRRRAAYWRAYIFYAGILLLIYITLCAYGALLLPLLGLPGLEGLGDGQVGASDLPTAPAGDALQMAGYMSYMQQLSSGTDDDAATSPIVPLTISLAMVGLAPSVPILLRIEEKIRFAAHRISGIPTRLVTGSRRLRQRPLDLGDGSDTLLIPQHERDRMDHCVKRADGVVGDPAAFHEDLAKIVAFRAWILQEKLPLQNFAIRDAMAGIEVGVARRIERLILDLDRLTGFEGPREGAENGRDALQTQVAWETAAKEADGICADVCVLLMLYVEHGIVPTEDDADRVGWDVAPGETGQGAAQQRALAQGKLMRFVSDAARWAESDSIGFVLWVRATGAALVVALLYGLIFGDNPVIEGKSFVGGSRVLLGVTYVLSAALTYALSLLIALSYHQSAYQNGSWRNVFHDNWARWLPQLLAVFVLSAAAAIVCHVGYNIFATADVVGWEVVLEKIWPVLRRAIEYEGPAAMRGPVLAILVILIVDAWRTSHLYKHSAAALTLLPPLCGIVMFVVGLLTRALSSQVGANARGDDLDLWTVWPIILEAGIVSGLIGLAVGYFVRATLVHEFPHARGADGHRDGIEAFGEPHPRAAE